MSDGDWKLVESTIERRRGRGYTPLECACVEAVCSEDDLDNPEIEHNKQFVSTKIGKDRRFSTASGKTKRKKAGLKRAKRFRRRATRTRRRASRLAAGGTFPVCYAASPHDDICVPVKFSKVLGIDLSSNYCFKCSLSSLSYKYGGGGCLINRTNLPEHLALLGRYPTRFAAGFRLKRGKIVGCQKSRSRSYPKKDIVVESSHSVAAGETEELQFQPVMDNRKIANNISSPGLFVFGNGHEVESSNSCR